MISLIIIAFFMITNSGSEKATLSNHTVNTSIKKLNKTLDTGNIMIQIHLDIKL